MKKLSIILIFIFLQNLIAHEQHAHQLITLEAYNLVKLHIGGDVSTMQNHLGSEIGYAGNGPWTTGLILSGAWREDNEDVVYGYSNLNPPTVTGPGGVIANAALFFAGIFNSSNEAYSSVTHFWEPDNGDNLNTTMEVEVLGIHYQWTVPNAYQKITKYANGNWEILGTTDNLFTYNGNKARLVDMATGQTVRRFYYSNLIDLYKTGKVEVRVAAGRYILDATSGADALISTTNGNIFLELNDEVKNTIVWEILGRMCHLLQDMTIPSHVHNDAHGDNDVGIREDPYETSFGSILWTAQQVKNNVGGLFDISSISNPIHYLMYNNAQMSDHFAGAGPYSTRIDNLIEGNYSSQEYSYLNSLNLSTWGEPTTFTSNLSSDQLTNIRNKLIPQAIRSTATLLYWFAKEAEILPVPITGVTVFGSTDVYNEGTYHWYAQTRNGILPFTYNWQIMYIDGAGYLKTYEDVKKEKEKRDKEKKDKKKDGDIVIEAAPSNSWVPIGTNSNTFSKSANPYDLRDFKLRCIVKDATNTTKTSNEHYVYVHSTPPPQGSQMKENGGEVLYKEMEKKGAAEVETLPSEYSLEQNYPNPFNPSTIITYSLPQNEFITLKVYDILGKEISTLVNENKSAGKYSKEFNASDLPSGTYIYKLTAGNYSISKKMSFVK